MLIRAVENESLFLSEYLLQIIAVSKINQYFNFCFVLKFVYLREGEKRKGPARKVGEGQRASGQPAEQGSGCGAPSQTLRS